MSVPRGLWVGWCIGWVMLSLTIGWVIFPANLGIALAAMFGILFGVIGMRGDAPGHASRD